MLSLSVNGYTQDEVIKQLHAQSGSQGIKFRYDLLNENDVKIGELAALPGNRIKFNSEAEIKRTGSFSIKETNDIDWLNDRIRPVYCLRMPDGNYAEWPLGVFLISSPRRQEENRIIRRDIEAYDPSLILVEDKFTTRYIIKAGNQYVAEITTILNDAGIQKVNITDLAAALAIDKEFEIGTPKIKAINQLLSEINYTPIWVDANGYFNAKPYVLPSNREADYTYRNDKLSVIYNQAIEEVDLFSVPNSWVVVASTPERAEIVSRYINDLPTSPTSTYNRKRTIVDYRRINDIYDQTTLDDFTKRLAYESSWVYGQFIFDTLSMPHHSFEDCLFCEYTDLGIAAKYVEKSWDMDLSVGGKMTHSARKVIFI
jgi:hypothetical protein